MFSKRHYEAIALAMQDTRNAAGTNVMANVQQNIAEQALADLFRRDNGIFNRERFLAACVPGANVKARTRYAVPRHV